MQVKHVIVQDPPRTVEELIARGPMLMTFNTRGHGDDSDTLITVSGYVVRRPSDGILYLSYATPQGIKLMPLDEDEWLYRIVNIMEIVE